MFNKLNLERFLIVSHNLTDKPFRIVGTAYGSSRAGTYVISMRLFPGTEFYLSRDRYRPNQYVIYSGRQKLVNGEFLYHGSVGNGVDVFRTGEIELYLPDLRQIYYLSPDPQFERNEIRQAS